MLTHHVDKDHAGGVHSGGDGDGEEPAQGDEAPEETGQVTSRLVSHRERLLHSIAVHKGRVCPLRRDALSSLACSGGQSEGELLLRGLETFLHGGTWALPFHHNGVAREGVADEGQRSDQLKESGPQNCQHPVHWVVSGNIVEVSFVMPGSDLWPHTCSQVIYTELCPQHRAPLSFSRSVLGQAPHIDCPGRILRDFSYYHLRGHYGNCWIPVLP